MSNSLRTPLARVRGHGAAKSGTGHFIAQRTTAVINLVLSIYLVASAALTLDRGYDGAIYWIADPINAAPLALFMLNALYHMRLGMQVVIEDYIARPVMKFALLLLNTFTVLALAAAGVFAILFLVFGA